VNKTAASVAQLAK